MIRRARESKTLPHLPDLVLSSAEAGNFLFVRRGRIGFSDKACKIKNPIATQKMYAYDMAENIFHPF